ncbi:hypothetical protein HMPREF1144_5889 [Klebsiella sp. OBRC7]|nr:hypothetical protein HMPREF1144_5889 [Klebsiella sp. OBRC7]
MFGCEYVNIIGRSSEDRHSVIKVQIKACKPCLRACFALPG